LPADEKESSCTFDKVCFLEASFAKKISSRQGQHIAISVKFHTFQFIEFSIFDEVCV
jgi:hypothetical protein